MRISLLILRLAIGVPAQPAAVELPLGVTTSSTGRRHPVSLPQYEE